MEAVRRSNQVIGSHNDDARIAEPAWVTIYHHHHPHLQQRNCVRPHRRMTTVTASANALLAASLQAAPLVVAARMLAAIMWTMVTVQPNQIFWIVVRESCSLMIVPASILRISTQLLCTRAGDEPEDHDPIHKSGYGYGQAEPDGVDNGMFNSTIFTPSRCSRVATGSDLLFANTMQAGRNPTMGTVHQSRMRLIMVCQYLSIWCPSTGNFFRLPQTLTFEFHSFTPHQDMHPVVQKNRTMVLSQSSPTPKTLVRSLIFGMHVCS